MVLGSGPRSYERLTALDAAFLHAESERTPLHIGALVVLEGEPFFDERGEFRLDDVRRHVESRLHLIPRFRRRIMTVPYGVGRPVWVDDPHFDIADHVRLLVLPPPGDREQLELACDRLQMQMLDRDKPLWELWFVAGLEHGRVAIVEKVHHALVDGVSGVDVAYATFDVAPEGREDDGVDRAWEPQPAPAPIELLVDSLVERVVEPAEWIRTAQAALRAPRRTLGLVGELAGAAASIAGSALVPHPSSLNVPVGEHRRLHTVDRSLDEVRAVKSALGGTVNDVVLCAVAGGLRNLLEARGEEVEGIELQALAPVSLRREDEHGALGNRVAAYFAPLPLGIGDAVERLEAVATAMRERKARHQEEVSELLLEGMDHLPPALPALLSRTIHRQPFVNVVVTNVPGPPFPMWFMGAEIQDIVPVVPLGGNLSIGIAVLSYNGRLVLGIMADPTRAPDAGELARAIGACFDELAERAESSRPADTPA